jgi:hypothetical protein
VTLNLGDPALDTRPPESPPRQTIPTRGSSKVPWWWMPVVLLAIGAGVLISAILLNSDDAEQESTLAIQGDTRAPFELQAEYATDTPIVLLEPGFETFSIFVGGEANLDPDVVGQTEYMFDTPLVVYEPGFYTASFFVGTDANLDPEIRGWHQIEYERDTSLVIYEPGFYTASFFVGTDAGLDPDVPSLESEYETDTPLVIYSTEMPTFWIGTSGEIAEDR